MKQIYKTPQVKPIWAYGPNQAQPPMSDFYWSGITTKRPFITKKKPRDMLSPFPSKGPTKFVPRSVVN